MEACDISGGVIGFLTDRVLRPTGYAHPLAGTTKTALEAEIAIHVGTPVDAGADRDEVSAAIAGLGAAIEIADVDRPPPDLEQVVAGNVYNRVVILGPVVLDRAGGSEDGLRAVVSCDGTVVAEVEDVKLPVGGDPVWSLQHVAAYLAAFDHRLAAGDVVISGSLIPLQFPSAGQTYTYELAGVGLLDASFV